MDAFMDHTKNHDNNVLEQQRLEGQHEVMIYTMGKPVYTPIDFSEPGLRILDSGCANGRWLKDLRASSPAKHDYVGTDVEESIFPSAPLDGMRFQIQSIKDPWHANMQNSFDLVHQRFVLPAAAPGSPKPVVAKLVGLLKPGGWLQLIEMDTDPNPENGPALESFIELMRTMFKGLGLGANFSSEIKEWMEEAGLKDVQETVVYPAHGETIGDRSLKQKSIESPCSAVAPILAIVKSLPHSFTDEQLHGLENRLRDELDRKGGHTRIRVVWGRK